MRDKLFLQAVAVAALLLRCCCSHQLDADSRQHPDCILQLLQLAVRVTLVNSAFLVPGQRHAHFFGHTGIGKERREAVPQRVE